MAKITPMLQQYLAIKEQHKDKILFFRVGDFYEMFFEDAVLAARELDIVLTTRDAGSENPVPLAGVPYHAADTYIARLIEKGYKVAICDQVEDPRQAKGIVKREITRIITPGTVIDPSMLEERRNNYLAALLKNDDHYALATLDHSTGEFGTAEFRGEGAFLRLLDELYRLQPSECIYNQKDRQVVEELASKLTLLNLYPQPEDYFSFENALVKLKAVSTENFNLGSVYDHPLAARAAGALISYLESLGNKNFNHLQELKFYTQDNYMILDKTTHRNLELTQTIREGKKKGSLLSVLDQTRTAMGGRMLRSWLEKPLIEREQIERRLAAVEELVNNNFLREDLASTLKGIQDLERLASRINLGTVNARDLIALKNNLSIFPQIKALLEKTKADLFCEFKKELPELGFLVQLIQECLRDDPPLALREGGLIRNGYSEEVDQLRRVTTEGKEWLLDLEKQEKEKTEIKSLKIRYNKVFGYYIEVTKPNIHLVPAEYIRKQTLVNAERYITEELKDLEEKILRAEEKLAALEYRLFEALREEVAGYSRLIQQAARVIARIDCILSLSLVAVSNRYCRPKISKSKRTVIKNGRHPVVELYLEGQRYIPNDAYLDRDENRILIITGPNMAGKSTFCRSVALTVLMCQIGSFVPAEEAEIDLTDRIFARVGASDDLSAGQSTFMVEMEETAAILKNATSSSLVILDEIGRGTSTYDGMSIAQAVLEYIHEECGARTLFSTHYHELTSLEDKLQGVKNYYIAVKEKEGNVLFLRRVLPGKADRSYGVNVARLAGIPPAVTERANEILKMLENNVGNELAVTREGQISFFPVAHNDKAKNLKNKEKKVLEQLKSLNLLQMTPLEALNKLHELQQRLLDS
ncbi:MAG: DNA mismatch repair protein MutS [Dethiobacteria bacterium]|nr:DNA mismatch repair protein MutS [Bacillota bacterium]